MCEARDDIQGVTLRRAEGNTARPVFREYFVQTDQPDPPADQAERAIFLERMKLIASPGGADELYDLARDPTEQKDIFRPGDSRASALAARLHDWVTDIPVPVASSAVNKDLVKRLRSFGYAQQK